MSLLNDINDRLSVTWRHRILRFLKVDEGVHDWCPMICPCDAYDGLGDDEDDDGELAA